MASLTPIRQQYLRIKKQHPHAILLFRIGDFYETFDEDAEVVARELEITLTSRELGKGQRVPLAGIPYHALESYLARLIKKGYRVAICEQVSDPATSKGLVERQVVRVVTPGTVVEPSLLEQKANNYLAVVVVEDSGAGLAYADVTTSEFAVTQLPAFRLPMELERLGPAEVLMGDSHEVPPGVGSAAVTRLPDSAFDLGIARQMLEEHFNVSTLEGYGCAHLPLAVRAAGALVHYLRQTQQGFLSQLTSLHTYSTQGFMTLDLQTRRNLELFGSGRFGTGGFSLYSVLDLTRTAMGGRLLRRWLGQPLLDLEELERRLSAVEWFHHRSLSREQTVAALSSVSDLERLVNRVRGGSARAGELVALRGSLEVVPKVRGLLEQDGHTISWLTRGMRPCQEVVDLVAQAIQDDPAREVGEGRVIREGFSPELDELRLAARNAREYIAGLERQERAQTGITSLKVGYNKVFGYYIEVSKPNLARVPSEYIRRQTLVNAERFITPELKEYEALILHARDRMKELEDSLFRQVCRQVTEAAPQLLAIAEAMARVDVFCALAEVASRYGYIRPRLDGGEVIDIKEGRHPVVERAVLPGTYVPNDTYLCNGDTQIMVLTGPNMSGKSTYIRQVALITLLAQIGSFVPAREATIGLVDRIFTRVGLQDDLATGQSTFMVEMVETAQILNHATPRSLIVLDEIGRGTSTYDGLAIARAVAEHLHNHPGLGCKTLFATHYHEMMALASRLPRVRNFNVAVAEGGDRVIFLHRIVPGGADKSYGVHVAQMAGLPPAVVQRAWELLQQLEAAGLRHDLQRKARPHKPQSVQFSLFAPEVMALLEELARLEVLSTTPLQAVNLLYELQKRASQLLDALPSKEVRQS